MKEIPLGRMRSKSKSGIPGITWRAKTSKWVARWTVNGRRQFLGLFDTLDDAEAAINQARGGPLEPVAFALVSDEDFEWFSKDTWVLSNWGYAYRHEYGAGRIRLRTRIMHREVAMRMGLEIEGAEVDHRDRQRLNNQRENIRIATSAENKRNASVRSDNSSGIKGIYWSERRGKWIAEIMVNGKKCWSRQFATLDEAAAARAAALPLYHGEFACHG